MEWIETTAKSVPEAKEMALDKLGVDETEAEFEVLEEPKAGLFGRVRGHARVRARIAPKAPRAKAERGDRRRPKARKGPEEGSGSVVEPTATAPGAELGGQPVAPAPGPTAAETPRKRTPKVTEEVSMDEVRESVEQFLTGLTVAFGLDAAVTTQIGEDETLEAHIEGKHGLLLGPKGRTLEAIQELCRVTAQRTAPSSIRIRVDVGGYREARRAALVSFAEAAAQRAVDEGVEVVLEPMNAGDRKIIHDTLSAVSGVETRSAGNDPRRRVIVVPDAGGEPSSGHPDEDDDSTA